MIVAFSTSSPIVSVALLSPDGGVRFSAAEEARQNASGVALSLLDQGLAAIGSRIADATLFAADTGPGSFIGARVAVTLAKTFAYASGVQVLGANSFDLIAKDRTVVLPSRKLEFFIRVPGQEPFRASEVPAKSFIGYGSGIEEPQYPSAAGFAALLADLTPTSPYDLMPTYLLEPSISSPKTPYRTAGGAGG